MEPLLLSSEFTQRVLAHTIMSAGHAQGAAPLAGHTREALSPGEVVHSDATEMHIFGPQTFLSFKDGGS